MMIYPQTHQKEAHQHDKVKENWIVALSTAGDSCIDDLPDRAMGSSGKPADQLLQPVSKEMGAVRCQ
jgi:hypothetical protein